MDAEYLDIQSDDFNEIVEDIKQRNLSKNNMPKLIIGTGLSLIYGVPGMQKLAEHLTNEISKLEDASLKEMWNSHYAVIKDNGLEVGLANLTQEEDLLVETIKTITARYILECEEVLHTTIWKKDTGFSKLMRYLSGTVGVNRKIIDVMTPNYDRVIEIVCDKIGLGVISGFHGNLYLRYDRNLLKQPSDMYNCKNYSWIRLFKPHGSINWINENGDEYMTNDYNVLREKAEYIEIVSPGSSKYRVGAINNTFRCMREDFHEILRPEDNYSLFFYGYGFNDDHFDTALYESFHKNVLILAKDVKAEIINKALEQKSITVFYQEEDREYMIYKSKKYRIGRSLWDIDQFADVFLG